MVYLADAIEEVSSNGSVLGVEFWAALLSLLTAIVVTAGPSIVKKLFPPDKTVSEIAVTSTAKVAETLDSTLAMLREDLGAVRAKIEENGKKIDAIGKGRR